MDSKIILLSHPSMFLLARRIAEKSGKSCSSAYEYLENGVKWDMFKDGFPNLFIDNVKHITNANVVLLASFHNPQVIFEQLSLIYAIPRYMAKSFTLVLPYFPTGTMERVDLEGQIATAKTLAQLLSAIPLTGRGPAQILIFDIHALQERFYFSDTVIPRLETAFTLLSKEIVSLQEGTEEEIAIAFPDEGAYKRFHVWVGSLPNVSLVVCTKVREENRRVVKIKEGKPSKRHVIIVDDLVQSGGTIIECAKVLLGAGASKISAFATHAVFPCDSWKQFTDDPVVPLENFWITDSLPLSNEISKFPPFKLLSLDQVIVKALLCD